MADTPLDRAHAEMETSDSSRLAFYRTLAETELVLLLDREPDGGTLDPRIFDTGQGRFVLAFDTDARLAAFAEGPAPYAALPGRVVVEMLHHKGLGLGLNLGVAPSSLLLGAGDVDWLHDTLRDGPEEIEGRIAEVAPPGGLPEALLTALDAKLARAEGLARMAYLAAATYEGGARGHVLAVVDPAPGAEPVIARAVREALVFSGVEAGVLDVTFLPASDPLAAMLARVGLRFDLPQAEMPRRRDRDPSKPPKLR